MKMKATCGIQNIGGGSSTQDDLCRSNIEGRDPCNPCGVDASDSLTAKSNKKNKAENGRGKLGDKISIHEPLRRFSAGYKHTFERAKTGSLRLYTEFCTAQHPVSRAVFVKFH